MEERRDAFAEPVPSPPLHSETARSLHGRVAAASSSSMDLSGGRNASHASLSSLSALESLSSMPSLMGNTIGHVWRQGSNLHSSNSLFVLNCWVTVLGYASKLCSLLAWFTALMCFVFANFVLPIVCGFQMLVLDYVLCLENFWSVHWVWLFVVCELGLLAHLMRHRAEMHAVGSGSFQWIVYSWLISTKCSVLYFHVLPDLEGSSLMFDLRMVVTILWLTPVFYTILTFRTLRELFQSDHMKKVRTEQKYTKHGDWMRDKQEHTTLDVVLLTDMVWHVVIDMIDIFYMMLLSNPFDIRHSIVDPVLVTERPETVKNIRMIAGVFIFLGLFFHQQSFPSIGYTAKSSRSFVSSSSSMRTRSRGSSGPLESNNSAPSQSKAGGREEKDDSRGQQPLLDYRVDVVKARKRSAIVSILMVDLPFLIIRTYMYILSMNTVAAQATTTTAPPATDTDNFMWPLARIDTSPLASFIGQRQLDKFWVKNILCMLLQAMQLRFVQQADLERSQSFRWWDLRRSATDAASFGSKRRRGEHDRNLRRKWEEMDRGKWEEMDGGKLEAAMHDTGGYSEEDAERAPPAASSSREHGGGARSEAGGDSRPQGGRRAEAVAEAGAAGAAERSLGFEDAPPVIVTPSRPLTIATNSTRDSSRRQRRSPLGCCPCRRRPGCRCCSCDCSYGIVAHMLMGTVLGWLIAKVDFNQAVTDLVLGLGRRDS